MNDTVQASINEELVKLPKANQQAINSFAVEVTPLPTGHTVVTALAAERSTPQA